MYGNWTFMSTILLDEIITTVIGGTIILLVLGIFMITFLFLYQKRRQKHAQEKHELEMQFKESLLQTQLEIQEQTLKNISQEIHDNIGQVLSLAKLNLGTMDIEEPEKLQQKIDDSRTLVGKAIQDLRDLSKSLDADQIKARGLNRAIEYELEMIKKTGSYETHFNVDGSPYKLDPQRELILFRIVQEILNNIIKHAKANTIEIRLGYEPEELFIDISDNGTGFELKQLEENNNEKLGQGIRNMHSRAKLINAGFSMSSTIGKGTLVTIHLPLASNTINSQ